MTKVIIAGAGFGGLACALNLEKQFRKSKYNLSPALSSKGEGEGAVSLTLIDRHDFHLFAPNLYEVAAAEEEFTSIDELKKSITLPIKEIIGRKKITFLQGEVTEIDQKQKTLILNGRKKLNYDYLVLALGSTSDYFGIAGAKEHALPLKTLKDALRIKNQIEFAIELHRQDAVKKNLRIVVAGGGYTGSEFAAELAKSLEIIAWKNNYPPEKIELDIVEAGNKPAGGFTDRLSRDVLARLKNLNITVRLLTPIVKVSPNFIETLVGEKIAFDVLVWTVGVKAVPIPFKHEVAKDKKGRIETNGYLQVKTAENIFILGDDCCMVDENGVPTHSTAQDAIHQGQYVANIFPAILRNHTPKGYACLKHGFVVNLGGKWAIMDYGKFYSAGFLGYIVGQLAHLKYFASIVGWRKAIKYTWFDVGIYGRND